MRRPTLSLALLRPLGDIAVHGGWGGAGGKGAWGGGCRRTGEGSRGRPLAGHWCFTGNR